MATLAGWPTIAHQIAFATQPNTASSTWTDVTSRVQALTAARGRSYEFGQPQAQTGTMLMRNDDGALDPTNTSSTYYPNVLSFKRARSTATIGATVYTICSNLVEQWPQTWGDDQFGTVTAQLVDPLASLNTNLAPIVQLQILADSPANYWPLNEPATAISSIDVAGGLSLTPTAASGAGVLKFAAALPVTALGSAMIDSPAGVSSTGALSTDLASMTATLASGSWLPWTGDTTAKTWECWYGQSASFGLAQGPITVGILNSNWFPGSFGQTLNHYVFLLTSSGGNVLLQTYLNGVSQGAATSIGALPTAAVRSLTAFPNATNSTDTQTLAHLAFYTSALTSTQITNHYTSGTTGFSGDTTGARVSRLLALAGYLAPTAIDAGATIMQAASGFSATTTLMTALTDCAQSELGNLYPRADGTLVFAGRLGLMSKASKLTLGDGAGETPYSSLTVDWDPTYVYSTVTVSRNNGGSFSATSATAKSNYFSRVLSQSISALYDADAVQQANWLLSVYSSQHLRIEEMTVQTSATGNFAQMLSLEIGDRVTVNRRPFGSPHTISVDCQVQYIQHAITQDTWQTSLQLSPFPSTGQLAAEHTTLHTTASSGASSLVLNALTTASVNPPNAAVPTTGWQVVINPGGTTAEVVTLLPPVGVAGGYSSATFAVVGTTVNAHSSGEVICDVLPVGITSPTTFDTTGELDAFLRISY